MKKQLPRNTTKRPLQARAIETQESLIKATAQFLMKNDVSTLSTNKVAEMAGVSIGSLYQYFRTKEELIKALVLKQYEKDFLLLKDTLGEGASENFEESIRKVINAFVLMFAEQPQLRVICFEQNRKLLFIDEKKSYQARIRKLLLESFLNHKSAKYKTPSELSVYVATSAITGILINTCIEKPELFKSKKFQEELVKLVLRFFSYEMSLTKS